MKEKTKTLFTDEVGNKLIAYSDGKFGVENNEGKLVTQEEFLRFMEENHLAI